MSYDKCQRNKRDPHYIHAPLKPLEVSEVFSKWHMDILSGFHPTKEGYKYILLVVGSFSNWVEGFALRTQTAEDIASLQKALKVDLLLSRHPC